MRCLKDLTQRHEICVITSIHQPNNDILMMFDKVMVMSVGGHCIYGDRPKHIRQYLEECNAEISRHQLPIEAILKISSNDSKNPIIQKMIEKTSNNEQKSVVKRLNEIEFYAKGIKHLSKRFTLTELWILLRRRFLKLLREELKLIALELIIMVFAASWLLYLFNHKKDINNVPGCIDTDNHWNNTCIKTRETLRDEELINYNINFIFYNCTLLISAYFIMPYLTFTSDLVHFINEHRNGKSSAKYHRKENYLH